MQALHHCDNPVCVRPDHLFLGKDLENQLDAIAKGHRLLTPEGLQATAIKMRKLSDKQVREVRELCLTRSCSRVGKIFGLNAGTIRQIVQRKSYKHV
jgi:hypothetical protein